MSEAKFTKGDWLIVDGQPFVYSLNENEVNQFSFNIDGNASNGAEFIELMANAHLIKTAPKMYSKLDELYTRICLNGGKADFNESDAEEMEALLADARGEK